MTSIRINRPISTVLPSFPDNLGVQACLKFTGFYGCSEPDQLASLALISTMTNQGQMRFMLYQEAMNASFMKKFLGRLANDVGRKVFLVVDNLKGHHSKPVQEW